MLNISYDAVGINSAIILIENDPVKALEKVMCVSSGKKAIVAEGNF